MARRGNKNRSKRSRSCRLAMCVSLFVLLAEFLLKKEGETDDGNADGSMMRLVGSFIVPFSSSTTSSSTDGHERDTTAPRKNDIAMDASVSESTLTEISSSGGAESDEEDERRTQGRRRRRRRRSDTAGVVE